MLHHMDCDAYDKIVANDFSSIEDNGDKILMPCKTDR